MYTTQSKCHRKYQNQAIAKFIPKFEQKIKWLSAFTSRTHTHTQLKEINAELNERRTKQKLLSQKHRDRENKNGKYKEYKFTWKKRSKKPALHSNRRECTQHHIHIFLYLSLSLITMLLTKIIFHSFSMWL